MNKNMVVISRDDYKTESDFRSAIGDMLVLLTNSKYACLFRYEDCGVFTIEYAYDSHIPAVDEYCDDRFMLVSSNEEDSILADRKNGTEN